MPDEKMDKAERLACLYLTFQSGKVYSFAELQKLMPLAYTGDPESARRKFERDKEDLKKLGIELRVIPPGGSLPDGSQVRQYCYYVPKIFPRLPALSWSERERKELSSLIESSLKSNAPKPPLTKDEIQHLTNAAQKIFYKTPGLASRLKHALGEFVLLEGAEEANQTSREERLLAILHSALQGHKKLLLFYENISGKESERKVIPRGLVARQLRWCLVAHCEKAKGIRSFYLDQIQKAEILDEAFVPDKSFKIEDYNLHPLAVALHEPKRIRLFYNPDFEDRLKELLVGFPKRFRQGFHEKDGALYLDLESTNEAALFSWLVRNPKAVLKIAPESTRQAFLDWIEQSMQLYSIP